VLVIWGEPDRFLLPAMAQCDARLVPHVRLERVPDASHWVHLDQPERVNALLIEFLSGG
jgi:pimeloyl-ACP methyl ester carboxylesterase